MLDPGREKVRRAPSGGAAPAKKRSPLFYGWVIVAVVFLGEFTTAGMGGITIPLFFRSMSEEMGWPLTQIVGAVTAQSIASIVTSPLVGPLLDRYGARAVMLFGALFAGIGLLLLMEVQAIWQFWLLYAVVGALGLNELGRLSGPVVVSHWFIRRRGRAMAVATSGTTIGVVIMAPVIGQLIGSVGWRATWGLLGVMLLLINVPTVLLFMRRRPEEMGLRPDGDPPEALPSEIGASQSSAPADPETMWTLREAVRTRTLWALVLAINLISLASGAIIYFQVPYLTQQGMSNQAASYIFTLTWVGFTISRLVWGFLVERIPVHLCLAGAFVARSLGPLFLVVVPYPMNIAPFLLVYGVFGGSLYLLQTLAFANYFGRRFMGSIQGTMRPLLSIPALVGPLFLAWLSDKTGNFNLSFLIAAALGILAAGAAAFASPPRKRLPHPQPGTASSPPQSPSS